MTTYSLADTFIYMKKVGKVTITSVNPQDDEYLELTDVAAEMFLGMVEKKNKSTQVVSSIHNEYPETSPEEIKINFDELVEFLVQKKILLTT